MDKSHRRGRPNGDASAGGSSKLDIEALYAGQRFASYAHPLIDRLARLLDDCHARRDVTYPGANRREIFETARKLVFEGPHSFGDVAEAFITYHHRLQSPRSMGHQVPAVVPSVSLISLIGKLCNQGAAVYEMGPFTAACEQAVAEHLGQYLGWDPGYGCIFTHGGSLANFTAVLAARARHAPSAWESGVGDRKLAVITSKDAHYSISRAAALAGLGKNAVVTGAVDAQRRMTADSAREALEIAREQGRTPFMLVGSACSTATGSFDDLKGLAKVAKEHNLWLHVDGAHGASLLLSPLYRNLLDGIESADSVTWDAHKLMFVPALCTMLFYREEAASFQTFAQEAPYLFSDHERDLLRHDSGLRTLECTKSSMAVDVWAALATVGTTGLAQMVERVCATAKHAHALMAESPDFEPLHEPQCNILCFRYAPPNATSEQCATLQAQIRKALLADGHFYITATVLDGAPCLRLSIMHPLTADSDIKTLLDHVRAIGQEFLRGQSGR